jgi:hypothetical protein
MISSQVGHFDSRRTKRPLRVCPSAMKNSKKVKLKHSKEDNFVYCQDTFDGFDERKSFGEKSLF